ncbi:hypothetical protein GCM10010483_35610 [Actinokineospora diospyrosa]
MCDRILTAGHPGQYAAEQNSAAFGRRVDTHPSSFAHPADDPAPGRVDHEILVTVRPHYITDRARYGTARVGDPLYQ